MTPNDSMTLDSLVLRVGDAITFRRGVLGWGTKNQRSFPWRESRDPYEVLLGELLLQRTRGEHVVEVYREMLRRWPEPARLARARTSTISKVIRPLGLAKRAPIIKSFAEVLVLEFEGTVPDRPRAAQSLPGVGPYASHAVQIFARDAELPLVDWVIARVLRRYFGLQENGRPNADRELWLLAGRLVEKGRARELWLSVLDLAASVCKPRPVCDRCPLAANCRYMAERDPSLS